MSGFGEILILPEKYIYQKDKELYSKVKGNPAEWQKYFKWWNLHEIMDTFHDGLIPTENAANYFNFKIDFTAPELQKAAQDDPELASKVAASMSKLNNLTNEIQGYITNIQSQDAANLQQGVLSSMRSRGGRKKTRKGGQLTGQMPMQNSNMPMQNSNMPMQNNNMPMQNSNMPMQNNNMPNNNMNNNMPMQNNNMQNNNMPQQPPPPPQKPYAAARIQTECFNSLLDITMNTRNRVFIVAKDMIKYNGPNKGGRKTKKTHKKNTRKSGGKRKTRKH
jgi:hypothetical protein